MKNRMLIGWLVLLLGAMLLTPVVSQAASPYGGVFKAAMTTNPPTLDAHRSTTTATRQVAIYLYETLVTFGENYEIIPQLAQSWDISSDRLTYTFHLRKGVKFHNGQTLTADDVKASVDRYIDISQGGGRFAAVKSIDVIDDNTVQFILSSNIPLLVNLAMPSPFLAIYPKQIVDKYGSSDIRGEDVIGTGPYKLLEWRPDVYVRLGRFEDYVPDDRFEGASGFGGKRIPYFDEVQLIPVPEAASRIAGFETGEFDFIESVPITSYEDIKNNPDASAMVVKPKWAILTELNQGEPPMDDVRFRQALVAALNPEDIMRAVTFGQDEFYRVQPSIFYPEQEVWFTEAGSDLYNSHDLALAKKLLKEAGYNNEPIIYLTNRDFDWMYKASLAIASQWQQAGINVQLEFRDWPSQIEKAKSLKGWHVNQTGWSPRFDPTQLVSSLSSQSVGSYNYSNPKMDELLSKVNSGIPTEERVKVWHDIQKLVWEDVAVIRMGDFFELEAIGSDVAGYKPFYVTPRFWSIHK